MDKTDTKTTAKHLSISSKPLPPRPKQIAAKLPHCFKIPGHSLTVNLLPLNFTFDLYSGKYGEVSLKYGEDFFGYLQLVVFLLIEYLLSYGELIVGDYVESCVEVTKMF